MPLFQVQEEEEEHLGLMSTKKRGKNSGGGSSVQDPKSAALASLGIAVGSKSRNLRKEDIDQAFTQKMHDSEYSYVFTVLGSLFDSYCFA